VIYRRKQALQPRDNILFELGLFTGRMGTTKCAFVIEKGLKVLTDLTGISLTRFAKDSVIEFVSAIEQIRDMFLANNDTEVNFFPSATLASVYFQSLINPICRYIIENKGFSIDEKNYTECMVNVIIPSRINDDVNLQFEKIKSKISTKTISFQYAGRPRLINIETQIKDDKLELIDFPTIIGGINHAISNLLSADFNTLSPDYNIILDRELNRFVRTLKELLLRNGFDDIVCIKMETESSKL
jgi:hypothetical protein